MTLADGYRYVDFAIRELARQVRRTRGVRGEVEVKLFGGSDVLPISDEVTRPATVGKQNCEAAMEVLAAEGFQLVASCLGGTAAAQFSSTPGLVKCGCAGCCGQSWRNRR